MTPCPMCTKWRDEPGLRVAELEATQILLNRDQFFPGYCFVVARDHVTELFHLDAAVRGALMEEVTAVAAAVAAAFRPDKVNYELLGNMVPHMHWHIIPRFRADPLWPRPVWSEPHDEVVLTVEEYAERADRIRAALSSVMEG